MVKDVLSEYIKRRNSTKETEGDEQSSDSDEEELVLKDEKKA